MQEETEIQPVIAEREGFRKNIVRNTFYNFLVFIINRIGALVFTIIIARLLQPELFGLYNLALSVMLILLTFADLGVNAALIRYISSAFGKGNKKKTQAYFAYLLKIKILLVAFFAVLLLILAKPLAINVFHKPELFFPLVISAFYLVLMAFLNFFESLFYALQKIKYLSIKEIILQIFRIALAIIFIGFILDKVVGTMLGLMIATFIAIIFLLILLKRYYSFLFEKGSEISLKEKRRILRFLGFLTISSIGGVFFVYIDTVMLGIFVQPEYIGFYRAAFAIVMSVAGLISVTNVLFPIFSQLKGKKLESAFQKSFHFSASLSFPCAFGLILIAKPFINLIYGSNYLSATIPLYILSFLIIESATGGIFTTLFQAREKPQYPTKILLIAAMLNIVLNYAFIVYFIKFGQIYAVLGAAAATLISRYYNFTALAFIARKKLNIKPLTQSILKPLIASIAMLIALVIFQQLTKLVWPVSMIEILFAAAVYFVILFAIKGIDMNEIKILLKSLLNPLK